MNENDFKENIVEKLISKKHTYDTYMPSEIKGGHGGALSVKIVLPSNCQANCEFCFNRFTTETQEHDYRTFLKNLANTLEMIFARIDNRGITLDITGNEPTFNINLFRETLSILKIYKKRASKIVLTTNGFRLEECINDIVGIVDIVNISMHHYDFEERTKIFRTTKIPNNDDIQRIVSRLNMSGISCTAVSVLYRDISDFNKYCSDFKEMAISYGFKDIRMRSNYCRHDTFINKYLNIKMPNEFITSSSGITTKIITDEKTGFKTFIFVGVKNLSDYVLGAELVIDDDGLCYIDYNKRFPVDYSTIDFFRYWYIYTDTVQGINEIGEQII